jgi:ABC-type glycerol-3-phosphate transport system substrate-binding protein
MKQYAPSGMLTDQGMEKWGTPDNNIAINLRFDPIHLLRVVDIPGLGERYKAARLFVNEKEGMGGIFVGSPFSIGKDSKNKELAWEFLKFSSSDFFQRFVYENYQEIPVIKSAHEWDSVKTIPQMEFMLDTMDVLWIPRYPYRAAQPRYILSENVEKLILGDVTPEDALNTAQKQAEDWVKELNK